MIRVENLEKWVGNKCVLKGISFQVDRASVLGIIGKSGSGKTTLLRCLCGFDKLDEGLIAYRDIQLSPHLSLASWSRQSKELRRHVGIVFQHLHLFPHMTVLENLIRAPMLVLGRAKSAAVSRAEELITRVGLEGVIDRYPEALSRGEQQLVALLRSLLVEPAILLMDEPTSGLDPQRGSDLSKLLREYAALGHTLIIVSHQMSFLKGLADDLLFLQQGRVIEHARTDTLLSSPQTEPTRQFLIHI